MSNFRAVNLPDADRRTNPTKTRALIPTQGNFRDHSIQHDQEGGIPASLGRFKLPSVQAKPIRQEWFTSPRCTSGLAVAAAVATDETWCRPSSVSLGVG